MCGMGKFKFKLVVRERPLSRLIDADGVPHLQATGPVKQEAFQSMSGRSRKEARRVIRSQMPGVEVLDA